MGSRRKRRGGGKRKNCKQERLDNEKELLNCNKRTENRQEELMQEKV